MKFTFDVNETVGARVARVARESLADGPMGAYLRGTDYADFLSIWDREQDLRFIHTSCAVYASAVLGYCGFPLHKPWNGLGGWDICGATNAWLQPLSEHHPAWVPAHDEKGNRNTPTVGSVIMRGHRQHVEVLVEQLESGLWRVCAGGGDLHPDEMRSLTSQQIHSTNGTLCRETPPEGKDIWKLDDSGRALAGWWEVSLIGLPEGIDVLTSLAQ